MTVDLIPPDEAERMAAVRRYDVLDTPPDGAFDRITSLAARLFDVPIAIVTIVDTDRIWFKSHHGLDVEEIERERGLCASAILHAGPRVITDAAFDPRTLANPLVAGELGLRFYAGVPLTTHDGYNLGTLCVIDQKPRDATAHELEILADLAALVMDELELRLSAKRSVSLEAELRRNAENAARALQEGLLPPRLPEVPGLDIEARYHVANREQVGGDFYDVVRNGEGCAAVVGDACGKGTRAASLTGTARWTLRTMVTDRWTPARSLDRLNSVMVKAYENPERYCTVALASILPHPGGGAEVTLSLGGHPHPLVVRCDGTVEAIGSPGSLVGSLTDVEFADSVVELSAGDVLVMFTDGLLEAVAGHGSFDDTAVREILRPLAGCTAADVADGLDAALPGDDLRDDAAFLVLRSVA